MNSDFNPITCMDESGAWNVRDKEQRKTIGRRKRRQCRISGEKDEKNFYKMINRKTGTVSWIQPCVRCTKEINHEKYLKSKL